MRPTKTKQINIRVTEAERAFWRALSDETDVSISTLIRAAANIGLGMPTEEEGDIRNFSDAVYQLRMVGTNLNQLTKRANQKQLTMSANQAEVLTETLLAVRELRSMFDQFQRAAASRNLSVSIAEIGS